MLLLALALAGCAPTVVEVDVLTYNVAGLPEPLSGSSPDLYMPWIGTGLNTYDLALVQEDFAYHDDLDAGADHPFRSEPMTDPESLLADGLNRFSRYRFGPLERVRWVACHGVTDHASDCLADKGFSAALTELADQVEVLVVNLHAEAGGGPEDVAARAAGFDQLATWLTSQADGQALLVAGDTNLHGDAPEDAQVLADFLTSTGLEDSCELLDCGEDHIDRILVRPSETIAVEPLEWGEAEEFVTDSGEPLSDHPAIRARLRWTR